MPTRERAPMPRRALLAGLAATPAVMMTVDMPLPAMAQPATPAAAPRAAVLAEVAELTRLYDAAMKRGAVATAALDAAEERHILAPPPEALFQRSEDPLADIIHAVRTGDLFWYGSRERIATLRGWSEQGTSLAMPSPAWNARYARRAEVLAAYDQWQVDIKAAEIAAGLPEAEAEYRAATEEEKLVRRRILELRSNDPAVLRFKVRAYLDTQAWQSWRDGLDYEVEHGIERENGPWSDAMAASIIRDIVIAHRQADA